ncbi:MAG: protein DegV [Candidatus Hepatoplasma vulgare]|nr:MAG: protein DegV [Candidatus Hepatoplasma sp.]
MEEWGVIFDSSCGLSKEKVEADGNFFIPLIVRINNEEFKAGDEIFTKDLHKKMQNRNVKIQTAAPKLGDIEATFNKAIKKYKKVVYIGISYNFSSAQNAARSIYANNDKYKGKIFIYDSVYSSPWIYTFYDDIVKIIKNTKNFEKIKMKLDFQKDKMNGYLTPGDIWWFYKGGRITKRQYFAGSLLRVKPILRVSEGKILEHVIKIRSIKRVIDKMMNLIEEDKNRAIKEKNDYKFLIFTEGNEEIRNLLKEAIIKKNNEIKIDDIGEIEVSTEQTAHMGPNSFGVTLKFFFPKVFF